ncbi:hypothetical protein O9992_09305 [Vibrio lentus]|nr:hypothetical protein [Vibrio lentus]
MGTKTNENLHRYRAQQRHSRCLGCGDEPHLATPRLHDMQEFDFGANSTFTDEQAKQTPRRNRTLQPEAGQNWHYFTITTYLYSDKAGRGRNGGVKLSGYAATHCATLSGLQHQPHHVSGTPARFQNRVDRDKLAA